ncbi:hypothetical protein KEM56_006654 [Ascosphaera pollenicola]|nr:hypothetical protein KEM56_006654 [Ascosphaera pollenicola]
MIYSTGSQLSPNVDKRDSIVHHKSLGRIESLSPKAASLSKQPLPVLRRSTFPFVNDDVPLEVEALLKSRRDAAFTSKPHLLRRHPSKTAYRQSEIYDAMEWLLTTNGSLDMMAYLLVKNKDAKPSKQLPILKSNTASKDVNVLLKTACELKNPDMVSLISIHADSWALDECLKLCLSERDLGCATILLRNGADPVDCGDIFLACARNQDLEVVRLLCSSEKKVSPATLDLALEFAAIQNEIEIVVTLLKGGANGDKAGVLGRAVHDGDIDIACALILSSRPPTPISLDKAIDIALGVEDPYTRETLVEMLLCGGAQGPTVNNALVTAVHEYNDRLMHLFVQHGASVTFNDAEAIITAISQGNLHAACTLLGGKMNPKTASHVLSMLPEIGFYLTTEQKSILVSTLVDCGAFGDALGVALVDAVSRNEEQIFDYLLENNAPVGYNNAQALVHAVISGPGTLFDRLLQRCQPAESPLLDPCFPILASLSTDVRLDTTRKLLEAGAHGLAVDKALATAVVGPYFFEKEALIKEFVDHGADVDVDDGKCFVHAATAGDISILSLLLAGSPSAESLSQAILPACRLSEAATRFTVIDLLLNAGAEGPILNQGLVDLMDCIPIDIPVIALLLEKGGADVNVNDGKVIENATRQGNVDLLCVLLQYRPSLSSLRKAFPIAVSLADAEAQYTICQHLLAAGVTGECVDDALISVQNSEISHPALLELLVTGGADINHKHGIALRKAIEKQDEQQIALLLSSSKLSTSDTLFMALSTLAGVDWVRKCDIARMLLDFGRRRSLDFIDKILVEAVKAQRELDFLKVLLEYGGNTNYRDGLPLCHAIELQADDIVHLLLEQKVTPSTLESAFKSSLQVSGRSRTSYIEKIFDAGYEVKGLELVMLKAGKDSPCDTHLVELLLNHGVSVHIDNDQSESCSEVMKCSDAQYANC